MTFEHNACSARITITNQVAEFPKVITMLEVFATQQELSADLLHTLTLCLDEVVTNISSYAYPSGERGTIDIELAQDKERLKVTISDKGTPFDPLTQAKEPDLDAPVETREIGGLGIHFVKSLMDHVSYEFQDGKNHLLLEKQL